MSRVFLRSLRVTWNLSGNFALSRTDGPLPGNYRVKILSVQLAGRKIQDPEGPKGSILEQRNNVVPDRYGSRSELKAEVKPAGSNTSTYEIDSTPGKPFTKGRR